MSYYGGGGGAPVPLSEAGDLLTHDGSGLVALPLGNEGQALLAGATGPEWGAVPAGPPGAPGADGATGPAGPPVPSICDARLTLTQGVPVTTSDVIGASTIYLTRYQGAHVALWDGSAWVLHEVPSGDVSLVLSGLTAGKVYDVFCHDAAGTLTLSLSDAWADNTTRTDALAYQDGVRVLASDHGKRLVGTFVATGADTTEDSGGSGTSTAQKRYLVNERHKVPRRAVVEFPWSSYTYSSSDWRSAGNTSSVYISALCGAGVPVGGCIGGVQEDGSWWGLALGVDGATTPDAGIYVPCVGLYRGMLTVPLTYPVSEGLHEFRVLEKTGTSNQIKAPTFWLDLVFQA